MSRERLYQPGNGANGIEDLLIPTDPKKIWQLEYARTVMNGDIYKNDKSSTQGLRTYFDTYFAQRIATAPSSSEGATLGYKTGLGVASFVMELQFGKQLEKGYGDPTLIPGWLAVIGSRDTKRWFEVGREWTEADEAVSTYLSEQPELEAEDALHYAESAAGLIIASINIQYASEVAEQMKAFPQLKSVDASED